MKTTPIRSKDGTTDRAALTPDQTLIVLLGASEWASPDYTPAPTFAASAAGLREYIFSKDGIGANAHSVCDLFNCRDNAANQIKSVRNFLRERLSEGKNNAQPITDVLIIAIAHGDGTPRNPRDLHLVVYGTERGYIDGTALPIRQIADVLQREAPRVRHFIIIDCCFSGAALQHFQSRDAIASIISGDINRTERTNVPEADALAPVAIAGDTFLSKEAQYADMLPERGTVLLCSSHADDISRATARDGRTLFSSAMLRVLQPTVCHSRHALSEPSTISFSELRRSAWNFIVEEAGADAPVPQLYAPLQTGHDLTMAAILPRRGASRTASITSGLTKYNAHPQRRPAGTPASGPAITEDEYISDFVGEDPVKGEFALAKVASFGPQILDTIIRRSINAPQQIIRLRKLCTLLGTEAVPSLLNLLECAPSHAKFQAAACFSALRGYVAAHEGLCDLLKQTDFEIRGPTICALGHVGHSDIRWQLIRLAKFDDPNRDTGPIYEYSFNKLYYVVTSALMRFFANDGDTAKIDTLEEFASLCFSRGLEDSIHFAVAEAMDDVGPSAADVLLSKWMRHQDQRLRLYAIESLESVRLQRTAALVVGMLSDGQEDTGLRVKAGITLGSLGSAHAAQVLAGVLADGATGPGVDWAFSILYAHQIEWPECARHIASALAHGVEVRQQMLLSLGRRRDGAYEKQILAGLHSQDGFVRGTSALALSHLRGLEAEPILRNVAQEASSDMEIIFALCAQINTGHFSARHLLHDALQRIEQWHRLRPWWRREVLSALAHADGSVSRAQLWAEISRDHLPQLIEQIKTMQSIS